MLSSRRAKKGPGRRPQSAKRQRFVEFRSRGWSIMAAAREVGVARATGHDWSRGYKVYRHGQVTGFVSALERLAVREISARYLSQDERIEIADLRLTGASFRQIADQLGRAPSTVSLSCAATPQPLATGRSRHTATRPPSGPAATGGGSRPAASCGSWSPGFLAQRWSPQQISRQLRLRFPASQPCGSVTRASTRPSTSPDHRWHRTIGPRCAPDEITDARISAPSSDGPVRAAYAHHRPTAFPA